MEKVPVYLVTVCREVIEGVFFEEQARQAQISASITAARYGMPVTIYRIQGAKKRPRIGASIPIGARAVSL